LQLHCKTNSWKVAQLAGRKPGCTEAEPSLPPGNPHRQASPLRAGSREAIIEHADEDYRLRLTKHGKLIPTA
jgi:hemin uptake protein HemP